VAVKGDIMALDFGLSDMEKAVAEFFTESPSPDDKKFHAWAEKQGIEVDKAEACAYKLATLFTDFLCYGRANEKGLQESDVDKKELAAGIKVEREHTQNDMVATRISLDHEVEFPKDAPLTYYMALPLMEKLIKRLAEVDKKEADEAIEAFRKLAEGQLPAVLRACKE
jgi:hypothetical protein